MSYQIGSLRTVHPKSLEPLRDDQVLISNGIPWLVQNPAGVFGNWQQRIQLTLKYLRNQKYYYSMWSQMAGRPEASRTRLQALAEAEGARVALIEQIFELCGWNMASAGIIAPVVTGEAEQSILNQFNNITRDWAWGENEIKAQIEVFSQLAPQTRTEKSVGVVVGAGAGRLAYELRRRKLFKEVLALESNPLLLMVGKLLSEGTKVNVPEFISAPVSHQTSSQIHTCVAQEAVTDLRFAVADPYHLPFANDSLDWILTPFALDMMPMHFEYLATEFNRVLKMGGRWVNVGGLDFMRGDVRQHLVKAELREAIHFHDFKISVELETKVPRMDSPNSRLHALETIDAWTAEKVGAPSPVREHVLSIGQKENADAPHLDLNEVIPLSQDIQLKRMQFEIRLWVLNQIDGKAPVKEIISKLSEQFGLNPNDAQDAVLSFLNTNL